MLPESDAGPEEVVVMLAAAPERALDLVGGLDAAGLAYRHGPAFPTVQELVRHMAESGVAADVMIRRIYLDGAAELPTAALHPDTSTGAPGQEPLQVLEDAGRSRRRCVDVMRGMREEDWARRIVDPELGEMDLLELCRRVALHEMGHLSQLRNLISLIPEHEDLGPVA